MNVRLPKTRTVSRDGVNAAQAFFEHNGCVFQEVAQQNDFGKDAYVEMSNDGAVTHLCIALQIKSGTSYRTPDHNYAIPVENHGDNWRRSTVPVFGLVYDPDDATLRWGDLTGYLRLNSHQAGGTVPISRDTILDSESLRRTFRRAAERYADAGAALGLLSDSDNIQEDAVFDAWALGRKDVRYLILLRRLILELRPRSVRKAIVALSHATPHPDIFWTDRNWIPAETKLRAVASFRWSPLELAHMLKVLGADDWGRGHLAQSFDMLVREDPSAATTLDQSIGLLLADGEEEAASGAALLVLANSEDPRATLSDLRRRHCELASNSWFKEIAHTIEVWGAVSLY